MTRFILPIILIGIAVVGFFMFTNPIYSDISALQTQASSYNDALSNSKALESERDKLTQKYNSEDPADLAKLQKMLPQNVDNIRLILEIEQLAAPYGMELQNIKYDANGSGGSAASPGKQGGLGLPAAQSPKDYGIFELQFSTSGTYDNFIKFTQDLQNNLRMVDIDSIDFSSNAPTNNVASKNSAETYTFNFKIRTYWLKS